MINSKVIKNIDVNLFSGSKDYLRSELGAFYHITQSDDTVGDIIQLCPHANTLLAGAVSYTTINEIRAYETNYSQNLSYIQTNYSLNTTSSADLVVKSRKFPVRIIGNQEQIMSDDHWRAIVLGGSFAGASYRPLYENAAFNDYSYDYTKPYSMVEAKKLAANSAIISSYVNFEHYHIGYKYKEYLPEYENKIANMDTQLLPNIYMLKMVDDDPDPEDYYPEYIRNFVSVEGTNEQIVNGDLASSLFNPTLNSYPPPYTSQIMVEDVTTPGTQLYEDKSEKLREYLTGSYDPTVYSANTIEQVKKNTRNLYYDSDIITTELRDINEYDPSSAIHTFPFYSKIEFPIKSSSEAYEESISSAEIPDFPISAPFAVSRMVDTFTSIIKDNQIEDEFLMALRYLYASENTYELNYIEQETRQSANVADYEDLTETSSAQNKKVAGIDFFKVIKRIYDQAVNSQTDLGLLMGRTTIDSISAENPDSKYRYTKVIKILNALQATVDHMENTRLLTEGDELKNFQELIMYLSQNKKSPETIAYRIKKVGGSATGTERRISTIQNMYFMNTDKLKVYDGNLLYYDTQVKYGEEYQYTLYAYVIVPGYEYKYSDIRLSRNIGRVTLMDETDPSTLTSDAQQHCLEFYDPNNNLAVEQLLNTETNLAGTWYTPIQTEEARDTFRHAIDMGLTMGELDPEWYGTSATSALEDFMSNIGYPYAEKLVSEYLDGIAAGPGYDAMFAHLYSLFARSRVVAEDAEGNMITIATPGTNRFATNAQIKSAYPFLADFNFHYMPTATIVEVPVAFKSFRILDNPPVAADVTPYQRKDNSQTIGFYVNVEAFRFPVDATNPDSKSEVGKYPTPMNSAELTFSNVYKTSNNMLEDELVLRNSISQISTLEVYRLDKRPNSIADFDGNLVYQKDLSMKHEPKYKYTNCFYEEKVATNKKFYYLFRFVNQHGIPGYIAPVQVAELIDDGGYKYATFDVIYESELEQEDKQQESIAFKKLLGISPSVTHMEFMSTELDYEQPAATQISKLYDKVGSAQDLIWGKTFKFRVTSKKTGKKIDFNVKYNLRTD